MQVVRLVATPEERALAFETASELALVTGAACGVIERAASNEKEKQEDPRERYWIFRGFCARCEGE